MSETIFSFNELQTASAIELPAPETIVASDGTKLSYRRYVPAKPRAAVLFYHGGWALTEAGVDMPHFKSLKSYVDNPPKLS